jgi:hypothetical protein
MFLETKLGIGSLTLAILTTALWFYLTRQVALPDDRSGFVLAWMFSASLGIFALIKGTSLIGRVPPALAIIVSSFLTFTIYISPQKVDVVSVIKVGDIIPQFRALDDREAIFESKSLNGHLVLIKFFRAHW